MIPLFAELCAGTAALSLRLQSAYARPPVSRMGNKQGYARAILRCLGLRSGSGAARYVWCEPDPGTRLLLTSFTDADLRAKAAAIIRGWKDEDPRALWERLKAEGPVKAPPFDPREVARWIRIMTSNRLINLGPDWKNTGQGGSTFGGDEFCTPIPTLLQALHEITDHPAVIVPDARGLQVDQLPAGSVAYIDPPYLGHLGLEPTTGYGHALTRAEVCELAERWAAAGARVVISESAPLVELSGWHTVEITGERIGQKRTFSRQKREWLTMNTPPVWRPPVQRTLWTMNTNQPEAT